MANRYWVGGTANWDATAGTKWATTSGGAGGASVPTSADDVYFDANSGSGTVTITGATAKCRNLTCTGFTGTLAGSAFTLECYGDFVLASGMTYTSTNPIFFYGVTGTFTVDLQGKTVGAVTLNGSATRSLASAFSSSGALDISIGTFTTNNYNVTATSLSSSNSNTRTINLGSSTVTLSGSGASVWSTSTTTGLTFNAGTSTVALSNAASSITLAGGGITFYNVSISGAGTNTLAVTGANTFNNFSVTGPASAGVRQVTFDSRQTINGTLSTTGTAGNRRVWFRGTTYGIAQTLTINSAPSLTDADFRDIYVIGTSAPISGTRIGDLRGCRGITFSTPKTVYWNQAAGGQWSNNAWALTSGGAVSTDNFPLAQDTAIIQNTGLNTSATLSIDLAIPYIGSIDLSGRTNAMTLNPSNAFTVYGNWTMGSGVSMVGNSIGSFSGRNTQTITSNGMALSFPVTVDSYGGTVQLADALNIGTNSLTVTNGTFNTQSYNVTASALNSSNSNVRTINLGSSTVTLSTSGVGGVINFATATNLTFNAGTSTVVLSNASTGGTSGTTPLTFYNLSLTATASLNASFIGPWTYNNFSVTAPASAGIGQVYFSANQTITGTLTCAGASAVRRIFLRSDTIGTTRTLTVGTLSATDCDFRDITIAGAAAGSSPTRAGNCGGNSGITFPGAKTVYWNLAGAQAWGATAWATSSGGTPDINNYPLPQDTAVLDDAGSITGTITITGSSYQIGTLNMSGRTSAATLAINAVSVYGNFTFGSGITTTGTQVITFAGRGTQTITSAGKSFTNDITVDCATGTVQLADALTLGSARTLTLTSGTFDAVTYNVTMGLFNSGNSNTRTLKMGSGTWTISGTASIWDFSTTTNLAFYKGTANITLSDTSTSARVFTGGSLSYNKLTIGGTTGTSTLTISGNNQFTELASTKTVAHTIALGTTSQTFGKWTVTGTVGNVVTVTGTATITIAGACTSGLDYLALGTTTVSATSPGEFYAGANSTATGAAAPLYLTAKPADSTRYWVGGTGNWSDTARWSTGSGGGSGASVPRSHDDVVFDSLSNATAYTATANAVTGGIRMKSLTIAGPASGNVTLAGSTAMVGIHGNVTLPATGLTRTYTGAITLSNNSTGLTFTTNGNTLASDITINGVNCGWSLGSALNIGTSGVQVTNGTLDLATYNLTANTLLATGSNSRTIVLNTGTITLSASTPLDFGSTETSRAALTVTASTSQINCSATSPTLSGNNQTFNNVSFTSTSAGTVTLNGTNSFNNLSFTGITAAGLKNISLSSNQTVTGTLTLSAGTNATMRTFLQSDTIGTTRTLTCAAVSSLTDIDFRDITIAGAAAPVSGTRLGDCKGNSGITFDAPKTVYWRGGTGVFGAANWSNTSGGSTNTIYFPLAQDTAIFNDTNVTTGATATVNASYNLGTIDMSGLTSNTMTLATGSTAPAIYGNWINGTGTTLTGTNSITFAGRSSQTITSAGQTFPQAVFIISPGGSVTLQDAYTGSATSNTIQLQAGTFDANGYNVTLSGPFLANYTITRTAAIGSGTWTLSGATSGGVWNASTSTNLTVTGTGTISLTSASAKTFAGGGIAYTNITLDQGGAGALTITGNNTFANITNSYKATGATTILLGTTTQRVGNFTASGEAGRVLTVQGTSASSPATLIYTGTGQPSIDYLTITGVRAYSLDTTWYAGANSTNNGSLGWYFESGGGGPIAVFVTESTTAADSVSPITTLGITVSESVTASEAASAGLIYLGSLAESATASDVVEAIRLFVAAVSEATTVSELVAAATALSVSIAEATQVVDSPSVQSVLNVPVSEIVAAAESLSGGFLFTSGVSEAAVVAEITEALRALFGEIQETAQSVGTAQVVASTFGAAADETALTSDTPQGANTGSSSLAETATASETAGARFVASATAVEQSTVQDSAAALMVFRTNVQESSAGADTPRVAPSTFSAVAAATAQAVESFSPAGSVYNATLPIEGAGITDSLIGAYLWNVINTAQDPNWTNIQTPQNPNWTSIDDSQDPGWQNIDIT